MGQLAQNQLKLGKIGFLNVLPIYYPLETGIVPHPFRIISGTPAYLNELMARGSLDLSVVSSIEYARHPENYFILPDLSISCCGEVKSVLLLSQAPIRQLSRETVLVSTESHTSVALLKILFSLHLGLDVAIEPGNCSEALHRGEYPRAFLAIGDEALRLRHHQRYPYCWDLGGAWHSWTGLPFVFALWVIQRKAVERWNGRLEAAIETLTAAKAWGKTHPERIYDEAVHRGLLSRQDLQEYYAGLGFNLDDGEQRGLKRFYRYLAEIGAIPQDPCLEIFSPLAYVA